MSHHFFQKSARLALALLALLLFSCTTAELQQMNARSSHPQDAGNPAAPSRQSAVVDVYLSTMQMESWAFWDKIRQDPGTRAALSDGRIRIKWLTEAAIPFAMEGQFRELMETKKLSLPPAMLFEGLLDVNKEMAFSFLDYMSKHRNLFHDVADAHKRDVENAAMHGLIDIWLKNNGYPGGVKGLLAQMDQNKRPFPGHPTLAARAVIALAEYWKEFWQVKSLDGTKNATPLIVVNGVKTPDALDKLFQSNGGQ